MQLLLVFGLVVVCLAMLVWSLREAARSNCPRCAHEEGIAAPMIPILFGLIFLCPNCMTLQRHRLLEHEMPDLSVRGLWRRATGGVGDPDDADDPYE